MCGGCDGGPINGSLKEKDFDLRILFAANLSFSSEGNRKLFSDIERLMKYTIHIFSSKTFWDDIFQ